MKASSQQVREKQLLDLQEKLERHTAMLTEKGKTTKQIAADSTIRQLKSHIRESKKRIAAIAEKGRVILEATEAKARRAAEKKDKAAGKDKAEPEAQKDDLKKKKKKKEKEKEKEKED